MRTFSLILIFLVSISYSNFGLAKWRLIEPESSLHFISTKNTHINEIHHFKKLSGYISQSGQVKVKVELTSVETLIPIRNTRMQEHLFKVKQTPVAMLEVTLPTKILEMAVGTDKVVKFDAQISIAAKTVAYPVEVRVGKKENGNLVATTTKPILIQAASHDLLPGIEVLKGLAGLQSIGFTVPVTFSVVFSQ